MEETKFRRSQPPECGVRLLNPQLGIAKETHSKSLDSAVATQGGAEENTKLERERQGNGSSAITNTMPTTAVYPPQL